MDNTKEFNCIKDDKMNKYNYKPPCSKEELTRMYYLERMTYREIAERLNITVKRVQTAMRKHGLIARNSAKRNQYGTSNANWKGDKAGYAALHRRLYNNQPQKCEVCGTIDPDKRYEWANLTGDYTNPKDYSRMCGSCHKRYDGIIRNITG